MLVLKIVDMLAGDHVRRFATFETSASRIS